MTSKYTLSPSLYIILQITEIETTGDYSRRRDTLQSQDTIDGWSELYGLSMIETWSEPCGLGMVDA
jgi:hypothetical protein